MNDIKLTLATTLIAMSLALPMLASAQKTPIGNLDGLQVGQPTPTLVGWAYDPKLSNASIPVHMYIDGAADGTGTYFAGAITADRPRPDVNTALGITGTHGFLWPIPEKYQGPAHTFYVYAINTQADANNQLLSNSPLVITVPKPTPTPTATPTKTCYTTNGIRVCHNQLDESLFYDTPPNEVAYNVEMIKDGSNYYTVYHSESYGKPIGSWGDSIKTAITSSYTLTMPAAHFSLWESTDLTSLNFSGTGNPMTVSGPPGDPYFYIFFLGVMSDSGTFDETKNDQRDYIMEARTKDFNYFDVKTANGWVPFSVSVHPLGLKDTAGKTIRSVRPASFETVFGLIGSISYVNGVYHYFYQDWAATGSSAVLYHRTTTDIASGVWSPPEMVTVFNTPAMRIAKANNMDRWVVVYQCRDVDGSLDICLQYTNNLSVIGSGGISTTLTRLDGVQLGLRGSGTKDYSQIDWLTDRWGNLAETDGAAASRGGELYWSDFAPVNCTTRPTPGCPIEGGKVYRAAWDITTPTATSTPTPAPTPSGDRSSGPKAVGPAPH